MEYLSGVAISRLKIPITGFYDLTPLEFHYAMKDHTQRSQLTFKDMMEGFRWHILNMLAMNGRPLKKGTKISEKLAPLPWDKKAVEKKKPQTLEEQKKILYAWAGKKFKRKK